MKTDFVRDHYNEINQDYLNCWRSQAKQNISRFELNLIDQVATRLTKHGRIKVLEIGVGPGRIAEELLKHNIDYFAADISPKMVSIARSRFSLDKKVKEIINADITVNSPFQKEKFDLIVVIRVIYYSKKWKDTLRRLKDKLNPGGTIIFCTLNNNSSAVLGKLINKDKLEGYFTDKKELEAVLKNNNLKVISFAGYARVPDVVYDKCDSWICARILKVIEFLMTLILGKTLFMRMYYVVAERQK